ncbi:hypothetical protein K491DRAFT_685501 [Lophiostoma macrostomum CBS 122681]|uniref:Nephrocystin 3-like N-terminal domain-containing protein n=1 Tax=Lophiostoma macrostomum CBS 122681 TaxID=1314788 RepID=A0A6A6SKE7_9PLEO|nr:hypothetical protein K491DRAFT_685501 [Lophiostoma macrostomum CBS 122681]
MSSLTEKSSSDVSTFERRSRAAMHVKTESHRLLPKTAQFNPPRVGSHLEMGALDLSERSCSHLAPPRQTLGHEAPWDERIQMPEIHSLSASFIHRTAFERWISYHARILTFGYDASFRPGSSKNNTTILYFAKDLLFEMRYTKDELDSGLSDLQMGQSYMQGHYDPDYEAIVDSVGAIIFLSTPHRGTNLAETLNRILQALYIAAPKQFILELTKNSYTLQTLNEQFWYVATKLDIVSFYEMRKTPLGFNKGRVIVLEKDPSVLGYPGEISKPLDADHHGVCKHESRQDPLYITVRNVLESLVLGASSRSNSLKAQRATSPVSVFLSLHELPDSDFAFFRDRWSPGTCKWILSQQVLIDWLEDIDNKPHLLWIHGSAASGKSVLSSFIIDHLSRHNESDNPQTMVKLLLDIAGYSVPIRLLLKDVEDAIDELPLGMKDLYIRMAAAIAENHNASSRRLAHDIVAWTLCARRPMIVDELSNALGQDAPLDLQRSVGDLYGGFVVVVLKQSANELIFRRCLECLTDPGLRINSPESGTNTSGLRNELLAIYQLIPPFCPHESITYEQFGRVRARAVSVSGSTLQQWDDCLGRLSLQPGSVTSSVLTAGGRIAVLRLSGRVSHIHIYSASTFEETRPIVQQERVMHMGMNMSGSTLVTYGYLSTKLWTLATGECIKSVGIPSGRPWPHSFSFIDGDMTVLVGCDDRQLRSLDLQTKSSGWDIVGDFDELQHGGTFVNSPTCVTISPHCVQIVFGYRGHPVTLWEVDGPTPIAQCTRTLNSEFSTINEQAWGEVIQLTWHPFSGEILGLYIEGVLFE